MGSGASIEVPADADRETLRQLASQHYGEEKVAEVESKYDEWAKAKTSAEQNDLDQFLAVVRCCCWMSVPAWLATNVLVLPAC